MDQIAKRFVVSFVVQIRCNRPSTPASCWQGLVVILRAMDLGGRKDFAPLVVISGELRVLPV